MNWLTSPLLAVEKLTMRFGGLRCGERFQL